AVDADVLPRYAGPPQRHAAARGGAAHPRLDHADGERSGDRRIDGVAARFQNCRSHFRRAAVIRGRHAAARRDDRLAHDLRVREVVGQLLRERTVTTTLPTYVVAIALLSASTFSRRRLLADARLNWHP